MCIEGRFTANEDGRICRESDQKIFVMIESMTIENKFYLLSDTEILPVNFTQVGGKTIKCYGPCYTLLGNPTEHNAEECSYCKKIPDVCETKMNEVYCNGFIFWRPDNVEIEGLICVLDNHYFVFDINGEQPIELLSRPCKSSQHGKHTKPVVC
jgi:hypothetical protein